MNIRAKNIFHAVAIVISAALVMVIARQGFAWTNPTQAPPLGSPSGSFGQWTTSGNNIYSANTGNVGIGAASPSGKLDVTGVGGLIVSGANLDPAGSYSLAPLQNSGKLLIGWNRQAGNGEIDLISNRAAGGTGGFNFYDYTNSGTLNHLVTMRGDGNVGIGTTNPGAKLDVNGVGKFGASALIGTLIPAGYYQDASNGAYRSLNVAGDTGYYFQSYNGAGTMMYVGLQGTYAGSVGIGTAGPAYKLDVQGKVNANSASGNGGYISTGNYGGTGNAAYFPSGLWSNGTNAWVYGNVYTNGPIIDTASRMSLNPAGDTYFNGGNVGIGTSYIGSKLTVGDSSVNYCNSSTYICVKKTIGAGRGIKSEVTSDANIAIEGEATGSYSTGIRASGISNDFYAAGVGTDYGSASSIRWKSNIRPIDNALGKIMNIRGVVYDWDAAHGGKKGDLGFIAEEVGKEVPQIVSWDKDAPGYATGMDYGHLTPVLVEAIKEQQKQIEEQKKEIEGLKKAVFSR